MSDSSTRSHWRLKSIKIRSFRGVAGEQTYRFDGRPGLLHGNNGVGKSTVAQSIQWTLYGKFPSEVLANTSFKTFLSPVSAKSASWFGEVTFQSGDRTLVITRDESQKEFSVAIDSTTHTGAEAEAQRDRLLGLDMAGFVRTVLLQQSRIRGLLLDSPKDRNEALDRLLGMDDIEAILSRLKPKDFINAATARREKIIADQQRHHTREELLVEQRDAAQTRARELKFLNKDFNIAGLKKAYAAVGDSLSGLARKYEVELEPLPDCNSLAEAVTVSSRVSEALRSMRTKSKLQLRLAPLATSIAQYLALEEAIKRSAAARDEILELKSSWVEAHGEHTALVAKRDAAQQDLDAKKLALKAAGELRQLLADGKSYVESDPSDHCPLCEQSLSSAADLISRLTDRLDALASKEISDLETDITTLSDSVDQLNAALEKFAEHEGALAAAQQRMDQDRERVVKALGGHGIPEGKVEARLVSAIAELEKQQDEISKGVAAMEEELSAVDSEERRLREGLVPVLKSRADLIDLEDEWKKAQKSHEQAEKDALGLHTLADQITALRTALLEAKNQLASDTLSKASPRANELYQRLVRHPVFDTLALTTVPKANKIDYSFEVSTTGAKNTAREARLVLSDGQVTATAIGLFFALSDADTHNLDLLYVDDPTQNLDLPCKEAMSKVVTELAQRRQVIVSTQDEDFVSFLEADGFFDVAVVHHIERWDGNPSVKTKAAS